MKLYAKKRITAALALTAVTGLSLAACVGDATPNNDGAQPVGETLNLQFNSYLGPNTPQAQAISWLWDEVEKRTNGAIQVEEFYAGALLAGPETLAGVANGLVDIGFMTVLYNPGELPLSQVVAVPFTTKDVRASHITFNELAKNNEQYQEEWSKNGVELIYMIGTPSSVVGTKDPTHGTADLDGKLIRSSGYIAQSMELIGASAVGLASPEIYEAVQRGTIDGYSNNIIDTAIVDQKLNEVAPWIAETGLGLYTVNALIINPDVWAKFTDEQKAIFNELSEEFLDKNMTFLNEVDDQGCQLLLDAGGGATVWSDAEINKWKNLIGDSALEKWKADVIASGQDWEAFYADYTSLLDQHTTDVENGIERCAATTAASN